MRKSRHRAAIALAVIYLLGVVAIVFWPTPVDRPASGALHATLTWLHQHGMPSFIGYSQVEFTANVMMFVPMGLIVSVWLKNGWFGVIIGTFASCFIELFQALFLPERYASGLDVLANTLGAILGAALFYAFVRLWLNSWWASRARPRLVSPVEPAELTHDDSEHVLAGWNGTNSN